LAVKVAIPAPPLAIDNAPDGIFQAFKEVNEAPESEKNETVI
jgi:hypothetical protein